MQYCYCQIKLRVKYVYTDRERCKVSLDIYYWGAGLAVTRRLCDEQNDYSLLLKQKIVSALVSSKLFSLLHS
jgi:hypothetical protein